MNYLAHLHLAALAHEDPLYMVGGMMGDFVKGKLYLDYPQALYAGIQLHRKIDRYTDEHAEVLRAKAYFQPPVRRFAGIALDICFDHFLTKYWRQFSTVNLEDFSENAFDQLEMHYALLPPALQSALPRMRQHQILTSYGSLAGIDLALSRIAQRLTRGAPLLSATQVIEENYGNIDRCFRSFYPDIIEWVSGREV